MYQSSEQVVEEMEVEEEKARVLAHVHDAAVWGVWSVTKDGLSDALVEHFSARVGAEIEKYKASRVEESSLNMYAWQLVHVACETWVPGRSTLWTHIHMQLRGLRRFVIKNAPDTALLWEHEALRSGGYTNIGMRLARILPELDEVERTIVNEVLSGRGCTQRLAELLKIQASTVSRCKMDIRHKLRAAEELDPPTRVPRGEVAAVFNVMSTDVWTRKDAVDAMVEYWTQWVRGEGDSAKTKWPRVQGPQTIEWLRRVAARALTFELFLRNEVVDIYNKRVNESGRERVLITDAHPFGMLAHVCRQTWPEGTHEYNNGLFPHETRTWFDANGVPMGWEGLGNRGFVLPRKPDGR